MSKLTNEDILRLARLARLRLSTEEVEKYKVELTNILSYVERLDAADVKGLSPTSQVTGLTNVFREDSEVVSQATAADLLKSVPRKKDTQIQVKRMIG